MRKIKTNDEIIVVTGKDKGKRGTVNRLVGENKVIVSGINMVKRHTKPNPNAGIAGGIVEKEAPLDISNVAIFNPETNKADRVGFLVEDGKKQRVYKSTNKVID
ncbi:50S ribosomal protein L24 [Pseudohongiella nitratireducens]|jgi:large subunit ribosomal protein L24|uniref:Large ribosomal subunit protein uL24 n=1 Tax=Pseudohongiella nitratireducens TaxID=1768907 RepID=A0A916QKL2_9GAMM|nr:50S ribosomal protein L24 [Pseudohongiella nitratireducens]GFZ77926.1 50S ribosomal protein L24 [Pseudohongiella nitratireducens]